jgi:hypothetical protein
MSPFWPGEDAVNDWDIVCLTAERIKGSYEILKTITADTEKR